MIDIEDTLDNIHKLIEETEKQPIQSLEEIARNVAFPFRVIRCIAANKPRSNFGKLNDESVITEIIHGPYPGWRVTNNFDMIDGSKSHQCADVKAYKLLK